MKSNITIPVLLCLLLLFCGPSYGQSATKLSQISVKGNKFVTADGKTIVFRGLDTSDPDKLERDGHWNKEYFEAMKSWGANIVRFPVHPSGLAEAGTRQLPQTAGPGRAVGRRTGDVCDYRLAQHR